MSNKLGKLLNIKSDRPKIKANPKADARAIELKHSVNTLRSVFAYSPAGCKVKVKRVTVNLVVVTWPVHNGEAEMTIKKLSFKPNAKERKDFFNELICFKNINDFEQLVFSLMFGMSESTVAKDFRTLKLSSW